MSLPLHRDRSVDLDQFLDQAAAVILHSEVSESAPPVAAPAGDLRTGVDLGTAYLVVVVLDPDGNPLAGEYQPAEVARDGLVVDFFGAVERLKAMKSRLERRLGCRLVHAASGYPPGVPPGEVAATAHVLEAAGFQCSGMVDQPSAANNLLGLMEGAIVDVGGGTTGVAVIRDGSVVATADEPCGGTHFTLVISGMMDIPFEQAERHKLDPLRQPELLPSVRPVMEKVGTIVRRSLRSHPVTGIALVGGATSFYGMGEVLQEVTGLPTWVPAHPLLVTPIGIALHDRNQES